MNKPYFAKYVPVEGEINEGDKFWYKGYAMSPLTKGAGKQRIPDIKNPILEKVKLMLCGRDIKVGDKFRRDNFEETVIDIIDDDIKFIDTRNIMQCGPTAIFYWPLKDCIKVIGKISPEATFVIEGVEFDEDEFVIETGFFETVRIKIKCPCCGTFK